MFCDCEYLREVKAWRKGGDVTRALKLMQMNNAGNLEAALTFIHECLGEGDALAYRGKLVRASNRYTQAGVEEGACHLCIGCNGVDCENSEFSPPETSGLAQRAAPDSARQTGRNKLS